MEASTAAINDEPLFADKFDIAAPPDDWIELHGGCSPATRKWLYFRRKYLVDRVAGVVLLVLASPLIALLILIVRSTSRGPGLYRQLRVGHRGKPFYILKIRSMVQDAERDGKPVWCTKHDPRVTRLGAFLRKVHLDELPQLINVARGEMALVGPRPERPEIIKDLRKEIDGYEKRLSVMPGVTGLAQINLPPDETIEDVRRKQYLDLQYIQEANGWLDFRMLLATGLRMVGIPGSLVTWSLGLKRTLPVNVASPPSLPTESHGPVDVETDIAEEPLSSGLARV